MKTFEDYVREADKERVVFIAIGHPQRIDVEQRGMEPATFAEVVVDGRQSANVPVILSEKHDILRVWQLRRNRLHEDCGNAEEARQIKETVREELIRLGMIDPNVVDFTITELGHVYVER